MTDLNALSDLAWHTAAQVERAPGPAEKRLVLLRAFAQARRINPTISDDPSLSLMNTLLRQPENLARNLQDLWTKEVRESGPDLTTTDPS